MAKSDFAILGVTEGASAEEIKSAYRRLAKEFHPDHFKGSSEPFQRIQEAYSVLGNPRRRHEYAQSRANVIVVRSAGRVPHSAPEPLIPKRRPFDIGESPPGRPIQGYMPSADEFFEWLWSNIFR